MATKTRSMRITDGDYLWLQARMGRLLAARMDDARAYYQAQIVGCLDDRNRAKIRTAWQVLNAAGVRICDGDGCPVRDPDKDIALYGYLNDSHIRTALVRICEGEGVFDE